MSIPNELLATITQRLDSSRGPAVVDDAIGMWQSMTTQFSPLLGPLSTELLLLRSLETAEIQHRWLQGAYDRDLARPPFEALRRCLTQREPEEVADANRAMCIAFIGHLVELIGATLATRFLRAAFQDIGASGNQSGESA